jgi:hypothetical protein
MQNFAFGLFQQLKRPLLAICQSLVTDYRKLKHFGVKSYSSNSWNLEGLRCSYDEGTFVLRFLKK